ncbi:hypothetical protein [Spiroplasma endosymbiont of Apeira syringaria]|uniref:hypothetical protein n=1 Tax=Spiroplasma endosymbiont of Apeira syringaria TaxID=3066307 RepID=UPI0030CAFC24
MQDIAVQFEKHFLIHSVSLFPPQVHVGRSPLLNSLPRSLWNIWISFKQRFECINAWYTNDASFLVPTLCPIISLLNRSINKQI